MSHPSVPALTTFTAYAVYPPGTVLEEFDIEATDRTQAQVLAEIYAADMLAPGYSHVELGEPTGWTVTVTSF